MRLSGHCNHAARRGRVYAAYEVVLHCITKHTSATTVACLLGLRQCNTTFF